MASSLWRTSLSLSTRSVCVNALLSMRTRVRNPPPATLMLISDELEHTSPFLSADQQRRYYNLVLARTYTPPSMSCLYHTAEWLWQTLLARSQAITSYDFRKCTASGDSASSFLCDACYFTYLSVTDFTRHLSSEEHKRREILTIKSSPHDDDDDDDDDEDEDDSCTSF